MRHKLRSKQQKIILIKVTRTGFSQFIYGETEIHATEEPQGIQFYNYNIIIFFPNFPFSCHGNRVYNDEWWIIIKMLIFYFVFLFEFLFVSLYIFYGIPHSSYFSLLLSYFTFFLFVCFLTWISSTMIAVMITLMFFQSLTIFGTHSHSKSTHFTCTTGLPFI